MSKQSNVKSGARVQRPERHQVGWRPLALDAWLPGDHRVRSVWAYRVGVRRLARPGPAVREDPVGGGLGGAERGGPEDPAGVFLRMTHLGVLPG